MSELFREIEEDIKRERLDKLWQHAGRLAIWGSIIIISLTAIYVGWDSYTTGKAEEKTTKFIQANDKMDAGDYKSAIAIFSELAEDRSSDYYPIAMLKKADAMELSGDAEGAKKVYEQLSSQKNEFGELARINIGGGDQKSGVFQSSYNEKKAWDLLAAGNKDEAAKLFKELMDDDNTPRSMAQRASEVLRVIAPEKLTEKKVVK